MRVPLRTASAMAAGVVLAATVTAAPARAETSSPTPRMSDVEVREQLLELGAQTVAKRSPTAAQLLGTATRPPNPYTSMLTDAQLAAVDWAFWRRTASFESAKAAIGVDRQVRLGGVDELLVDEDEPDGVLGGNDTPATAQFVPGLGTGYADTAQARILGTLAPSPTVVGGESREDDGSIPLATALDVPPGGAALVTGTVGDGPHGTATGDGAGDLDHFTVTGLEAGQLLVVDTDTPDHVLDSMLFLWTSDGELIDFNDDDGTSLASRLQVVVPADGDYTVAVGGFPTFQLDPFNSGSGDGAGSEGPYELTIGVDASDVDTYGVDLDAGDVLSAVVADAGTRLAVHAPDGTQVMGSSQDASYIYPAETRLLGGGNAVVDHVAATGGRHTVSVTGTTGSYEARVRILRPGTESSSRRQAIFLDFDGEELDTGILFGPGVRRLSPLSTFLGRWGLSAADEDAVIDAIVATVRENVARDLRLSGLDGRREISLLTSRDHRDLFGRRNVSRVVVGGTIAESGLQTIGIAQTIDPGNDDLAETALVLLDTLSDPATGDPTSPTLNDHITAESDVVAFIGQAVGNVVSHEIGHLIGSWHVDQFNEVTNLMDQGGNFPLLFGVGPDGVGGTDDDVDVDFGEDVLNPFEGFSGTENTLARSFFALVR